MMTLRLARGTAYRVRFPSFVDNLDAAANVDAGVPTVVCTRLDGTVASAPVAVLIQGPGQYGAKLTEVLHTNQLDVLTLTITGTASSYFQTHTQVAKVVSSHYVTIPEMRARGQLVDTTRYPADMLAEIRDEYEELVEDVCGVSFVRQVARQDFGPGSRGRFALDYLHPRVVRSISIDGVAGTPSDYRLDEFSATLSRLDGSTVVSSTSGVSVVIEHGYDAPPPDLTGAMIKAMRADALSRTSDAPHNVISETFEGQVIRFSTPDPEKGRPTGILALDPILVRRSEKVPGLA